MKILSFLFLLLVLPIQISAQVTQEWVARYSTSGILNNISRDLAVDDSGNVYVTGECSYETGLINYATIKYNSSGVQQWVAIYNGPGNDNDLAKSIAVDDSGNVYVTGSSIGDYATIKYNSSGVEQWVVRYTGPVIFGSDEPYSLAVDGSGNVYVTGHSEGIGTNYDYATIKYNSSGVQQWVARYNGPGDKYDYAISIAVDGSGNVYVTGECSNETASDGDYATIKYNSSGVEQWVAIYNGPGNFFDFAHSLAVDNLGNVYVTGQSDGIGTSNDYATIKYNSSGIEQWVDRYNGPGNSSDNAYSIAVDGSGNVYVTGSSYGIETSSGSDYATIKYSQPPLLKITNPVSGIKWMAGEKDTIRWTGGKAGQFLEIVYSEDNGSTYNIIDIATPADSGYFIWNLPANILTTKAKIKITDIVDPTIKAVSDSFKIKGYVLTRLDANNQYVAFSPAAHGWQYTNGTLWPQSWWNQFQYATGIDPNTNELYPSFFHPWFPSTYIDWPLWVEVFGVDQCYYWTSAPLLGPNYKGNAQKKWRDRGSNYLGSCFGFAASSFLAFNFRDQFFQKHSGIPNVENIFNLNLTNTIQKTINGYFAYQYGKQSLDNDIIGKAKDPRTTLLEVMNMFEEEVVDIRTITIYENGGGGGGAHTMAPISVTKDGSGPSRYRVNLYDSNNPGINTPYILVDSLNNTWTDFTGLGATWTGNSHFYLEIPVSNYLNTPVIGKQLLKPKGIANIEFYNNEKANVMFTNSSGQKIGVTNGVVTDEIQDGIAIFNKNGKPSDPIGYYIPDDNYSVLLSNITDTSGRAFFSAFKQDVIYNYERGNVNVSQSDKFRIDEGFSVVSQDLEDKQINISVIARLDSSERILFVQETQLRQNDSLYLRETNQSDFIIKNYGTSKTYKLEINERSYEEQEIFKNLSISLQENSSHTIQPNWSDLNGSILNVLVDLGNDGIIDDTLSLVNQVTGIGDDQGSLLTPNSFNLAQNYPNPFNPTTKISWQSPVGSHQTLKVYDVLGNEVATLVDEFREAGRYEIEFNASNLSSGIYFYRLQAGSFVQIRKMLLLK